MQKPAITPEFSRPLHVEKVGIAGVHEDLLARPTERAALAERFGLIALDKLSAALDIEQAHAGKMLAVSGVLKADLVQQCVVTLEPLPSHIEEPISALFAPAAMLQRGAGSPNIDAAEEDDPEPFVNGQIDLGELVAQHLGLALDPYPRKAGVGLLQQEFAAAPEAKVSPFAVLKGLSDRE